MDPMISSDSHIVEPPDLWERWLMPELRPRAPKLVKDEDGGDVWLYNDGGAPAPLGLVTVTRGRPREELRWSGARYSTINQGNFRGDARVGEMLEDGVVAEVIYSPQRTMRHFMLGTEDDFHLAGIHAYNDWLAKDFCAKAPERLIGIGQMPSVGVEAAIAEMRRCKEMGLRGVLLSAWPSGNLNLSEADDAFFAEAERLGLPISIHCGLSARGKVPSKPKTPTEEKAARGEATGGKPVSALSGAGLATMPLITIEIILTGMVSRPAPESAETCFPPVASPRAAFSSVGVFGLGGTLPRAESPQWMLIVRPRRSASAKKASSASERLRLPLGQAERRTPRSPISLQRRISAMAASTPTLGICPMPIRRSGALAQKSFASQSL